MYKSPYAYNTLWLCGIISTILITFLVCIPTVFTESLVIYSDPESAGFQTASADATLSSLALVGVSFSEEFSPERTTYTAETSAAEVRVIASVAHGGASAIPLNVGSEDGYRVALEEEETMIAVTVTAEDGETTETYTITVVRPVSTDETVLLDESELEADVQTGIGPITKIIASLEGLNLNEVRVTWATSSTTDVTGWEHNYKTQDAQSWEGWGDVPLSTASTTTHIFTLLNPGEVYLFKIRAKGSGATRGTESEVAVAAPQNFFTAEIDFDANDNNLIDITTLEQLNAIRYDLDGDGVSGGSVEDKLLYHTAFRTANAGFFCTACAGYELLNDLDFDTDGDGATRTGTVTNPIGDSDDTYYNGNSGWEPIGTTTSQFATTFDGNGFVISNLYINRSTSNVGLFGIINTTSGTVTAAALKDVFVKGGINTGSLAGRNDGTVSVSYASGLVTGGQNTGGLVGFNNNGTITSSYSAASARAGTGLRVGGLVGNQSGSSAVISNSYSIGSVSGSGSAVGGFLGRNSSGAVTTSYWNTETSGQASSSGGTGKTTSELQTPVDYTGIYETWDDADVDGVTGADAPWDFGTATRYPILSFGGHSASAQSPIVTAVIATPGSSQATVNWRSSSDIGITGWEFTYKTKDAADWESWAAVPGSTRITRSLTVSSLVNGTTYLFKVRAVGGSESSVAVAIPNTGIPNIDFDANDNNLIDITTLEQLNAIRYDPDGDGISSGTVEGKVAYANAFKTSRVGFLCESCVGYELRNNLDLDTNGNGKTWTGTAGAPTGDSGDTYHNSGKGWIPIETYTGVFDGKGYIVDNLFVNREAGDSGEAGLFKTVGTGGIVRNLGLKNILVRTHSNAGGIAGDNYGTIQTSFVTGTNYGTNAGLFVARNYGTILHSYSRGSVGAVGSGAVVGGIAGNLSTTGGTIKNSWTATTVSQTGGTRGGISGSGTGTIVDSYFDKTVYGTTTDTDGITTVLLQAETDYANNYNTWNDADIDGDGEDDIPWYFGTSSDYPLLVFGGHSITTQQHNIIATPGDTQATLTWTIHNSIGVTGWKFTYKTEAAVSWEDWADVPSSTASTRSHTVASLTNGTTYLFKVQPQYGASSGAASAVAAVAVPGSAISAVDFDVHDNNLIDISTLEQLHVMRYDLDGNGIPSGTTANKVAYHTAFRTSQEGFLCDACIGYELVNELDFDTDDDGSTWTGVVTNPTGDSDDTYYNDNSGWEPIGTNSIPFIATFDGNGFAIKNLFINRGSSRDVGLFSVIDNNALLTEVVLKDVYVRGGNIVGSLVAQNSGTLHACYSTGRVMGAQYVGGLVGFNRRVIESSHSAVTVNADSFVGGFVGLNYGLPGLWAIIKNSYSTGAVNATTTNRVGGLLGFTQTKESIVIHGYWDTQTSGQATSDAGVGKMTSELQSPTGYTGIYSTWGDDSVGGEGGAPWDFGTTSEYPTLTFTRPTRVFTLDLDKGGTFVARQDLLGTYLYLAEGISDSQLRTYTHDQEQGTANKMAELIRESITGAAPPLDFDGNGTVTARLDVLGAYLYTAEGISASQLRAYTHNQEQSTANGMADLIDSLIE